MNYSSAISSLNSKLVREEFPLLHQKVNGHPLVYLDNAATTQKPKRVIQSLTDYYAGYNSNIHRGVHTLAEKATHAFEQTRETARDFIHAEHVEEIIFVRGVTEAINLVASSYGQSSIMEGDEVIPVEFEKRTPIHRWRELLNIW